MPEAPMLLVVALLLPLAIPAALATLDAAQGNLGATEALLAVTCLAVMLFLAATILKPDDKAIHSFENPNVEINGRQRQAKPAVVRPC
jgi:hypothetical protein